MLILILLSQVFLTALSASFSTKGNKVYDPEGNWVVFRGIGLTCTEYMLKPGIDTLNPYNGYWAYTSCFGGPVSEGGAIELNNETQNIIKYFESSNFNKSPKITKIQFNAPYNEILDNNSPNLHPIIRIPFTGSCYLYDSEVVTGNHNDYINVIDEIVTYFTNNSVAVVLDLHWNCPDSTTISGCAVDQTAPMALKNYGNNPGSIELWNEISKKYGSNPYVFYELFNEPYIGNFTQWYNGDDTYAGMKEMYTQIRANDPDGVIIIGGANQYALDAQTPIAMYLQYQKDTNSNLTNVIWNSHPYQGGPQYYEHSLQSEMRFTMGLKQIGPVIYTEFGQYCCTAGDGKPCSGSSGLCTHDNTADHFVYNILNFATQYDISTIGWGWRGTNDDNPCGNLPDCGQPDMRNGDGKLVNGTYAGANWENVWNTFIASDSITVKDVTNGKQMSCSDYEDEGYLPRPCIVGDCNIGPLCGYDLNTDINSINVNDMTSQSMFYGYLPGLPPRGNCSNQGCMGFSCTTEANGPCVG